MKLVLLDIDEGLPHDREAWKKCKELPPSRLGTGNDREARAMELVEEFLEDLSENCSDMFIDYEDLGKEANRHEGYMTFSLRLMMTTSI